MATQMAEKKAATKDVPLADLKDHQMAEKSVD